MAAAHRHVGPRLSKLAYVPVQPLRVLVGIRRSLRDRGRGGRAAARLLTRPRVWRARAVAVTQLLAQGGSVLAMHARLAHELRLDVVVVEELLQRAGRRGRKGREGKRMQSMDRWM